MNHTAIKAGALIDRCVLDNQIKIGADAQAAAWQEKGQEVSGAIGRSKDNIVQAVTNSKDKATEAVG